MACAAIDPRVKTDAGSHDAIGRQPDERTRTSAFRARSGAPSRTLQVAARRQVSGLPNAGMKEAPLFDRTLAGVQTDACTASCVCGDVPKSASRASTRSFVRRLLPCERRKNFAAVLAKADARVARLLAPAFEDHRIAIAQERAQFTAREFHWRAPAARQLDDRPGLRLARAGDRAGGQQVTRLPVAPADGVMSDHLRHRPVLMPEAGMAQPLGANAAVTMLRGFEPDLELNVQRPVGADLLGFQIRQRLWFIGSALPGLPIGSQCLHRHDPRRNRRRKVLAQKRAERRHLPELNVAGRPVVEHADAKDVRLGRVDGDLFALRIALADEDAKFDLVIQPCTSPVHGHRATGWDALSHWAANLLAADTDARD